MSAASELTVTVHVACLATSILANALDVSSLHDSVMLSAKAIAPGFRFVGPALVDVRINSAGYGTDWLRSATEALPGIDLDRVRGDKGDNCRRGWVGLAEFYHHVVSSPAKPLYI